MEKKSDSLPLPLVIDTVTKAWATLETDLQRQAFAEHVCAAALSWSQPTCRVTLWNREAKLLPKIQRHLEVGWRVFQSACSQAQRRSLDIQEVDVGTGVTQLKTNQVHLLVFCYDASITSFEKTVQTTQKAWDVILDELDRLVPLSLSPVQLVYVINAPAMPVGVFPYGKRHVERLEVAEGHFGMMACHAFKSVWDREWDVPGRTYDWQRCNRALTRDLLSGRCAAP